MLLVLAARNLYNSRISPWNVIFVLAGFTWLAQGLQHTAMRKLVNVKVSPGSASCARCLLKGLYLQHSTSNADNGAQQGTEDSEDISHSCSLSSDLCRSRAQERAVEQGCSTDE